MYSKVIILAAALIAVSAQDHYSNGHASSSQSFSQGISHNPHGYQNYYQNGYQQGYNVQPIAIQAPSYHSAPIAHQTLTVQHATPIRHVAPVFEHAPVISHAAPIISHAAPIISHAAPLISHSSPIISQVSQYTPTHTSIAHATPIIAHAAPIHQSVHYSAPTIQHAPVHYNQQYATGHQEYYSHPKYEFEYSVNDPHTGDIKSQHEARDGDHVAGSYSLHEADGSAYPKYAFDYKVEDHHTGDIKSQHELRDGDVVKGVYALHQPDGSERVIICLSLLVAAVVAQYGHGHGSAYSSQHFIKHDGHPEIVQVHGHHGNGHHDYHTHPHYTFDYKVEDPHTGDMKSQHESRDGDVVKGVYSLHQPDGSLRTVHYHGDHHTGLSACRCWSLLS
ncbi:unnamed protein product [Leptidea sinapis]|uniref:Uncharacterized protein n=1 Tax=Leptidea sinapis TaxID=189913 RepID=A0A5E4Q5N3_9NEOP|nr:unnamed protein product [Leptidea sinapis]